MIMTCSCVHPAQDKLNGKDQRVFNATKKSKGDKVDCKCTVCGTVKQAKPE